jgi:3-deoxy-D-manno-octulosonic-acid transferase
LGLRERLGRYREALTRELNGKRPLWIHAVSVGEAVVGSILAARLRERHPGLPLVVSSVTATGRQVALERIPQAEAVIYFPLDFPGPVDRALRTINPRLVLLTEGEIWPNFLEACHLRRIPVLLVNGRVSERSFRRYRLVRPVFRRVLDRIALFCMREEADARRILSLGADPERVVVTGNIKYDDKGFHGEIPPHLGAIARLLNGRPVWVAGSTHRGEETVILQAFAELRRQFPDAVLLIAPRHLERIPEVEALLREMGVPFIHRSALATHTSVPPVILVDTMGELGHLYALATVVFVGGSLVPAGGHNILEPARYRRPILFGPHMENFAEIAESFLAEEPAHQVRDPSELSGRVLELFRNPRMAARMGEAAYRVLSRDRGAAERTLDLVEKYL